jgi:hypothetical protein
MAEWDWGDGTGTGAGLADGSTPAGELLSAALGGWCMVFSHFPLISTGSKPAIVPGHATVCPFARASIVSV